MEEGSIVSKSGDHTLEYNDAKHRYTLNGMRVPGPTTFIKGGYPTSFVLQNWMVGEGAKSVLKWFKDQNEMDLYFPTKDQQIEIIKEAKKAPGKVAKEAADIGTILHEYAHLSCKGRLQDAYELVETHKDHKDLNKIVRCMDKFEAWYIETKVETLKLEELCASPLHGFAGRFDHLAKIGGKTVLIDYKTSKGFYINQFIQLAAYSIAIQNWYGIVVDEFRVVRFGKEKGEFEEMIISDPDEIEGFKTQALLCLKTYEFERKWSNDKRFKFKWGKKK